MTRRYFVPDLPLSGGLVALPTAEAQHATRVMRVQHGDCVTLFDGNGKESEAVVVLASRTECHCDAESPVTIDRESTCQLHLGIGLPKPDRAKELVERLTELGVKSITPIVAARSQRPPGDSLLAKLRRGVIEACKQSERNQLMEIRDTVSAAEFFAAQWVGRRLIAHPNSAGTSLTSVRGEKMVVAAIGPEGGWTDNEVEMATGRGFETVRLGKRTYRIETAATAVAAVLVGC